MIQKTKLVDDWKNAWKWLSIQFAVVAGAFATWAVSDPIAFARLMEVIPPEVRPVVGVIVTLIPIYLRLKKQGNNDG